MKKLFILLFIVSLPLIIKAEYSDYYRVYFNGLEVSNEETIVCNNAYIKDKNGQPVLIFEADINVVNQLPFSNLNRALIEYTDMPSYDEWLENKKEWGSVRLCYHGGDANGEMASCMGTGGIVRIPDNSFDCFNWEIHLENVPENVKSKYKFILRAADGELQWDNYEYYPDSEFYMNIIFDFPIDASVKNSYIEINEPKFYTISGIPVTSPTTGLFIEKIGSKTKKIFIK